MIAVGVTGIGIAAPGLRDWEAARAVLAGRAPYVAGPLEHRAPEALPPAERRRAGALTRLALAVAQEAVARAGVEASRLASVFASADADAENTHHICAALATPAPEISPTRFHNSVQNAPSGYWTIATQARAPTSSINGLDEVFATGLLEAAAQAAVERREVLLVAFDLPAPEPIFGLHPLGCGAAVALVLAPDARGRRLALSVAAGAAATAVDLAPLERLRLDNPALRALPLLAAIARPAPARVVMALDEANALELAIDGAA
jgi:hypothetical protein